MMVWVKFDVDNLVPVAAANGSRAPDDSYVQIETKLRPDTLVRSWWTGTAWLPRIAVDPPSDDGTDLVWTDVPEGTLFRVYDVEGGYEIGSTTDTTLTISEPGEYLIEITPPLPWLPSSVRITR